MKKPTPILLGDSPFHSSNRPKQTEFVELDGEPYICIRNINRLSPFLMSVVSDSDHWLFVGSNSPFTAGSHDPHEAQFSCRNFPVNLPPPDHPPARSRPTLLR